METGNETEWTAPPPPKSEIIEQPQMSEVATLGNIFFEPERTFEDLRKKPRFILASIIIALLVTCFAFAMQYKVGEEGLRRTIASEIAKSPQASSLSPEQQEASTNMQVQMMSIGRFIIPVFIIISFLIGGLLYWLGGLAFGGSGGFLHAVSVWVYSGLPPAIVSMFANLIVLFIKSADEINIIASQRGVIHANPSFLFGPDSNAVLVTLASTLDVFMIWGWILAAIGLKVVFKVSSSSAWTIVAIFAIVMILLRVIGAAFTGNPG